MQSTARRATYWLGIAENAGPGVGGGGGRQTRQKADANRTKMVTPSAFQSGLEALLGLDSWGCRLARGGGAKGLTSRFVRLVESFYPSRSASRLLGWTRRAREGARHLYGNERRGSVRRHRPLSHSLYTYIDSENMSIAKTEPSLSRDNCHR